MDLYKLQNGSDVRGVALSGVEGESVTLTEEAVRAIASGFVRWLERRREKRPLRIAVGRDSRLSGPDIAGWLGRPSPWPGRT